MSNWVFIADKINLRHVFIVKGAHTFEECFIDVEADLMTLGPWGVHFLTETTWILDSNKLWIKDDLELGHHFGFFIYLKASSCIT